MIRGLKQSHAWIGFLSGATENRFHQLTPYPAVLDCRVYSDWPYPSDWRPLVKKIATGDLAIELCHDTEEARMREQHGHELGPNFDRRNVRRKIVLGSNGAKRFEKNSRAGFNVGREPRTQVDRHVGHL